MSSLSAQLKRLAIPHTKRVTDGKSRPSLLFVPSYAAKLDIEHFYEIGLTGLAALTELNQQFSKVGAILFDAAAPALERSVQTPAVNRHINSDVRNVLLMLQPYLLLQPALKVLEWLVHRFYIEQHSMDDLLMLALPYHETPTFVKILQLVDISDPTSRWNWLLPIQGPGHPLGRRDLLAHCAGDAGLLKLVCETALAAAKLHGPGGAHRLATLAAFHAAIIIGTVQVNGGLNEMQMSHITKSLLRGLKSESPDFAAGAMMAIAQIAQKVQLGADFVATLVRVTISKSLDSLAEERVTLLLLLYATQHEAPPQAALPLVSVVPLADALSALADRGVDVFPLALPILDAALACKDSDPVADAAVQLVTGLTLTAGQARALADHVVTDCTAKKALCPRYCALLSELERHQGTALDAAVDRAISSGPDDANAALKAALCRHDGSAFLRLYHASAQHRALALEELAAKVDTLGLKDSAALGEALAERLRDDSTLVVLAALSFPSVALARLLGPTGATDAVLSVLARCLGAGEELAEVAGAAVIALARLPADARPERTLAHLFPHLMPTNESETAVALAVLRSPLAKRDKFLRRIAGVKNLESAEDICAAVSSTLLGKNLPLPPPQAFQEQLAECKTAALALSLTLLLTASLPAKLPPAQADTLARDLLAMENRLKSRPGKKAAASEALKLDVCEADDLSSYASLASRGVFPLPALLSALDAILRRVRPLETDAPFWLLQDKDDVASLELRCLSALVHGACSQRSEPRKALHAKALAEYLRLRYPETSQRIELLVQAACAVHPDVSPHLQVRFLRLASALLQRADGKAPTSRWFPALMLCSCVNGYQAIRVGALTCANDAADAKVTGSALLHRIVVYAQEIALDVDQIPTAVQHALAEDKTLPRPDQALLTADRAALIAVTAHEDTPAYIGATLLSALSLVSEPALLDSLAPLAHRLLDGGAVMAPAHRQALNAVLARYKPGVADALKDQEGAGWVLLSRCLRHVQPVGDGLMVAELTMSILSQSMLAALDQDTLERLMSIVVHLVSECDRAGVVENANRLVKRMSLHASLIAKHLVVMATASGPLPAAAKRKTRFVETAPSPDVVSYPEWRRGVTMLELAQSKKMAAPAQLLPSLFAVLARCLQFEQQAPVEYPKQLVLSLVLQCCERAGPGDHAGLNVEAVVQCIRASQNPQTHHHALLVLAQLAALAPRQVLHNVMSVFTFMGSSVLRQDDAYSVQVITKIVDTVVPIIVASTPAELKDRPHQASGRGVLRVFVDALPGIPSHRVQPLFQRLLVAIGPRQALWSLMALLLEAQVMRASGQAGIGLSLAEELPAVEAVEAAIKIVEYLLVLPTDKLPANLSVQSDTPRLDTAELFDVATHTEKQLRHYKFLLAQQVGALLAGQALPQRLRDATAQPLEMEKVYSKLLERLLTLVQRWLAQVSANADKPTSKYWRVMLTLALDTLDKVNGLLPMSMFLVVIKGLLTHRLPVLRRKAMELLNARLQGQVEFTPDDVLGLLPDITAIVATIVVKPDSDTVAAPACAETELCQQTALLAVKLLAHRLAAERPDPFVAVLPLVTKLVCAKIPHGNLQAAVVLCLAELCVVLRVRAVAYLPKFMPAIVGLLEEHAQRESPDLATLSVVTAADKISESLAGFLGKHLPPLLLAGSVAAARWAHLGGHPRVAPTLSRLATARQRLATAVPPRVLVPAVAQCYHLLVEQQEFAAVGPLLDVLGQSFSDLQGAELRQLLPALSDLFLTALELRGQKSEAAVASESHVITALVRLALKLSEEAFRPMFYSLFHWASTVGAPEHRAVTFYRLSAELARSLKGLFALFATASVAHAASQLSAKTNTNADTSELREYILESLLLAITHGGGRFVNLERFNALMQPIVNQLELAVTEDGADRARRLVAPCLAQLAAASENESQWKQLNYQVLLKTRDARAEVRLAALTALCQVASKLSADYLPLLPEAIPFLAELLEDEDEAVERAAQDAMREMQDTLGEPLDKYL